MIGLYNGLVTAKNILLDKHINNELVDCVENIKSYKFEDLKPNMWVWDDLIKKCVQLDEDCFEPNNVILILMHGNYGYRESTRTFFEENRFFPVQCANYLGGI